MQQGLELVDLALIDGQLGEDNDIDTADLLAGGDEHAVQEVEGGDERRRMGVTAIVMRRLRFPMLSR